MMYLLLNLYVMRIEMLLFTRQKVAGFGRILQNSADVLPDFTPFSASRRILP